MERAAGGLVAGVDEAGRGPLAGPVVAAAVAFLSPPDPALAALLDDSKALSAAARARAAAAIRAAPGLAFAVAAASAREIGALNIRAATLLAMARAVRRLRVMPTLVLVDGDALPPLPCPGQAVVKGDARSLSIAAASILAKVVRDAAMARLDARHPGYGFARHQGYPTAAHRAALEALGPCAHHRRGFAPVDAASARKAMSAPSR